MYFGLYMQIAMHADKRHAGAYVTGKLGMHDVD